MATLRRKPQRRRKSSGEGETRNAGRPRTREEYDAERSAATRRRILTAAFESLYELGYRGTTTVAVCQRAKLPRGTLLHHYPDRAALLVASLEHVFERRLAEFRERFTRSSARREPRRANFPDDETIDLLWEVVNGPGTVVWIDLVVASRSDPELSRELRRMTRAFDARIRQTFDELFPEMAAARNRSPAFGVAVSFTFALLNGMVLDRLGGFEDHTLEVLAGLKYLARESFPRES
jgi:AcrR family transcriptional regulator